MRLQLLSFLAILCLANGSLPPPPPCLFSNPCLNNGVCEPSSYTFRCRCTRLFTGRLCETALSPCLSNPCLGGGTCAVGSQDRHWYCICPQGKTGDRCEKVIHDCSSQPCQNGGSCCESQNGYSCDCKPGFTGDHCETDIDECLSDPCQNGGTCVDQVNGYNCQCNVGLTGRHCENKKPGCHSNTCLNGGSCAESTDGTWYCICPKTYKGIQCQERVNDCSSHPCQNGGSCCDKGDHYECTCPEGFNGTHCEIPTQCNCQNGGTCSQNSYWCSCPYPYTGRYCETHYCDIQIPCHNGGTCLKIPNGFKCICMYPFTGQQCQQVMSVSSSSSTAVCYCIPGRGSCIHGRCHCFPGYYGLRCEYERNMCTENICRGGGCIKLAPDYYSCFSSRPSPYPASTPPLTTTVTRNMCTENICPGKECTKLSPDHYSCFSSKPSPYPASTPPLTTTVTTLCNCIPGRGICRNGRCACVIGYYGPRCEHEYNMCSVMCPGKECIKLSPDQYSCFSSKPSPVSSTPPLTTTVTTQCNCQNGGTCSQNSDWCSCPYPYTGRYCETHYCDLQFPCYNGGTCLKIPNGFRCICMYPFTGQQCQQVMSSVSSSSSSSSTAVITSCFSTRTTQFYSSSSSATPSTMSSSLPITTSLTTSRYTPSSTPRLTTSACHCLNGGTCLPNGECYCPIGLGGPNCGYYTDYCLGDRCKNGGTCYEIRDGYSCSCLPGISGQNCEFGSTTRLSSSSSTTLRWTGHPHTTILRTSSSGPRTTTVIATSSLSVSSASSINIILKRSKRDTKKESKAADDEDKELKRICKLNELKARKTFSDKPFTKKNWKTLHPAIKAVLMDLVTNDDHRRSSSTHAQIKKAVARNDLMKMSKIMAERRLWMRVPVARFWKRKQIMKNAVENPWKTQLENKVLC